MMVGIHDKLQSETGYIDARPHPPSTKPLAPHGRTIHSGHERLNSDWAKRVRFTPLKRT